MQLHLFMWLCFSDLSNHVQFQISKIKFHYLKNLIFKLVFYFCINLHEDNLGLKWA